MKTRTVLHSELTKITTLRSLWVTPICGLVAAIAISAGICNAYGKVQDLLVRDPSVAIYYGLNFGQATFICFGILLIGQEYNSGTIQTSLTAVPRRGLFYWSKLAVCAGVSLALGILLALGSFLAGHLTVDASLDTPGAVRALIATALYVPLLVVFCLGATAMLRSLTAGMGLLLPILFILSPLISSVDGLRTVVQFLPDRAGQYSLRYINDPDVWYGHWTGLAIMAAWSVLAAVGGWLTLNRKDA